LFFLFLFFFFFSFPFLIQGIYPRVPPNGVKKRNKTYYHVKDIKFLMHDPIIAQIRKYKTYRRKLKKYNARHEKSRIQTLKKSKPEFNFDHMIKERYPTFVEAVRDLDDALSMIFLFATLPANKFLRHFVVERCMKLSHEWTSYAIRSRSIRKSFCSIKGVYFQASIQGETCTWMAPYPFTPNVPENVDFKVMVTFLEFHMKHVEFVLFRLYGQMGLSYPPVFNKALSGSGATVMAYQFQEKKALENTANVEDEEYNGEEMDEEEAIGNEEEAKKIEAEVAKIQTELQSAGMDAAAFDEEGIDGAEEDELMMQEPGEEFQALAGTDDVSTVDPLPTLFRGLVFFVGRENLRDILYTALASCGAKVGWEGVDSPFGEDYEGITHVVCDRPSIADPRVDREYVQPQWVLDSINFAFLLPCAEYTPGKALPPHLSPFVDDEVEGYVPERKLQILRYIDESKGIAAPNDGNMDEDDDEVDHRDAEDYYQQGLAAEMGTLPEGAEDASTRAKNRRREREEAAVNELEEEKALKSGILTRKKRRLYERIQYGKKKKVGRAERLKNKAENFKKSMHNEDNQE
jgi:pescadillo protein